jgi:hypothetical protein
LSLAQALALDDNNLHLASPATVRLSLAEALDTGLSTTRLQTCLTRTGLAAFDGYLLRTILATGMTEKGWSAPRLRRLVGLQQERHECLAVQLEGGASGAGKGGSGDRQRQLETVWKDLRGVLAGGVGGGCWRGVREPEKGS